MTSKASAGVNKGIMLGLISAFLFAMSGLITRHIFNEYDVDGFSYVVTFSIITGACGLLAATKRREFGTYSHPEFKKVVFISLVGVAGFSIVTFAQGLTSATNVGVLSPLVILATALWSIPLMRQKPTSSFYRWLPVMLLAIYLVIAGFELISLNFGDILVIIAMTIFGFNNAYVKKLVTTFEGEVMINFRMILGAIVVVLMFVAIRGDTNFLILNAALWPLLAGIARYLNLLCFFKAISYISATNAILLSTLHVVITVVLAGLLLGEGLTPLKIIGSIVIVLAAYMIVKPSNSSTK